MATEIQLLDSLCQQLYVSVDQQGRLNAEQSLADFSNSPDCMRQCMLLFEQGTMPYAPLVASNTLMKLIVKTGTSMEERYQLRNYLLNYLVTRQNLPNFVVTSVCQLFSRLTKFGWFDYKEEESAYIFRTSIDEFAALAQEGVERCILAVQLLGHLVAEMNSSTGMPSITKQRKVASNFRDVQLFEIFQLTVSMLQTAYDSIKMVDNVQLTLIDGLLQLALNCLNFDYIGSVVDDTTDDNVSVQVPTVWRVAFVDCSILKLFFGLYHDLPANLSSKALACIVQLASIRRTIFNNSERQAFLEGLTNGAKELMERPEKLADQATFHEFCRLVARLKSNYQLCELMKVDEYSKILRLLAEFTVQSLRMFEFSSNSTYYLLAFWQRMVASMPYVKSQDPHLLNQYCPMISAAFIDSRIQYADTVIRNGVEDPLDDLGAVHQIMEQFSVIGRCEYEQTCQLLIAYFDREFTQFQALVSANLAGSEQEKQLEMCRNRLTWLVTIIAAAIGGRVAFSTCDEHDLMDGDLICRVFRLMSVNDDRLNNGGSGCIKLETALIYLLDHFRKVYISDQIQKTSKVYGKLSTNLGLNDESAVLAILVRKVITNLKYWPSQERLVDATLALLNDLSVGYTSVRKLIRLPEIQMLMNNHTVENFVFLGSSTDLRTMKSRTTFYASLTRLLLVDLNDDEQMFQQFLQPLTDTVREVCDLFQSNGNLANIDQERVKRAVIGFVRDVRGITIALTMKMPYTMLFDWLYPNVFAMLTRALELWRSDVDLAIPVLKLMMELCQNRSQRLQFEMSSPNAILLFKETTKVICTYGTQVLEVGDVPKDQQYRLRYKGIGTCFGILKMALSGSYVNFGVFRLYGDSCLDAALNIFVKMLLTISISDLLAYPKLSQHYYYLLESIAQDHLAFLSNLDPEIFAFILRSLHDGLSALDSTVVTGCCSTLDLIVTYLYKRVTRPTKTMVHAGMAPEGDNCLRTIERHPDVMQQMLSVIMNTILYDECRSQWSMSRPLLGLILLQEDFFRQYRISIVQSQQAEVKRRLLDLSFDSLMEGVERNLSVKNKDTFTQNLSTFRREVSDILKGPPTAMSPSAISTVASMSEMMAS